MMKLSEQHIIMEPVKVIIDQLLFGQDTSQTMHDDDLHFTFITRNSSGDEIAKRDLMI